ncbi:MAG: TetR/AcrR family transcriptional regulator [Myxococcales bacterium]|nr:TetR/AcrR family transcriptional regulator [Myxococcales bacterium]
MGLREQQQDERRRRILDAARHLIRKGGPAGLAMRELAREAGVGLVTPYNLFGGKGGILHALLVESVDDTERRIGKLSTLAPVELAFAMVDCAVDHETEDPEYGRALLRALWEQGDLQLTPQIWGRCIDGMTEVLRRAKAAGDLATSIREDLLARQQFFDYMIALEAWSNGLLCAEGLRAQCRYGLALALAAAASEASREAHREALLACQRALSSALDGRGSKPLEHASPL